MGNKILLVDDDERILMALKRELADEDFSVFIARSATEALDLFDRNLFQVVVADVKMPGITGFELLAEVKEINPDTVQMVLSGHPDVQLILREVNKRAIDRYILKPWDSEVLKMLLRQGIALFDLRRQVVPGA